MLSCVLWQQQFSSFQLIITQSYKCLSFLIEIQSFLCSKLKWIKNGICEWMRWEEKKKNQFSLFFSKKKREKKTRDEKRARKNLSQLFFKSSSNLPHKMSFLCCLLCLHLQCSTDELRIPVWLTKKIDFYSLHNLFMHVFLLSIYSGLVSLSTWQWFDFKLVDKHLACACIIIHKTEFRNENFQIINSTLQKNSNPKFFLPSPWWSEMFAQGLHWN
jgi:hypothetical protein